MSMTRRLQFSMAVLVVLGTVLLGLGQPSPLMPFLAIFAAGTSLIFTDLWGWFRLHRVVANLAAVAAAVFSLWNFFREPSQEQLLSIANLLSILLMILLYQEKNSRLYWQISVLSLLQVVVAAALNLGLLFGILLVAYALVAMSTLILFYLHREASRLAAGGTAKVSELGNPLGTGRGLEPQIVAAGNQAPPWHLPPVTFQSVDRDELERPFLGRQLVGQVASVGSATLFFALILFYSVPRLSSTAWQGPAAATTRVSGFTPQVTFDEMGEILQNRELVMRVEFSDERTKAPYVVDQPYFRGALLVDYEFDGESTQWSPAFPFGLPGTRRLRPAPAGAELVREEITFASSAVSTDPAGEQPLLFSTHPIYPLPDTPRSLRYDMRTGQLFRVFSEEAMQSTNYRYVLGTTAFRNGFTASITPHVGPPLDDNARRRLLRYDRRRHAGLRETASQVLADLELGNVGRRLQAQTLQAHFFDPRAVSATGEPRPYTYSLRPPDAVHRPDLDPVENFVTNHRTGHCEYFASALVLMLRSQGIPARLALGYKGGEYNSVGGYWHVRQSHAHAWVEAYLEPDEVPAESLTPGESAAAGAWLLLDPTPPDNLAGAVHRNAGPFSGVLDLLDYAQFLWNDYVVGLNSESQRRTIYPPVDTDAPGSFADVFSFDKWREFFANAARFVGIDPRAILRGEWFSWRGGLLAVISCLVAVGLFRVGSWIAGRLWGGKRRRREGAKARVGLQVEFYRKLAALLAQRELERRPAQTQREFALAAETSLASLPAGGEIASIPRQVVEAFYRVRFGSATLDSSEAERIEQDLQSLERSLA